MPDLLQTLFVLSATFLVSTITLLTGFGIGTVLTPAFALFYDAKIAVFLVSIVHLANNVLKLGLFHRSLDKSVLKRFGLVSVVGALAGSLLQGSLDPRSVGVILGVFLLVVGIMEFLPSRLSFRIPRTFDVAGGLFSGMMGGLIGNQGALRSAYLLNYPLSKEAFVATATSISILIDLTRIPVYIYQESTLYRETPWQLFAVMLVAFGGTFLGRELLKKIPLEHFRFVIAGFLIIVGIRLLF